MIYIDRWLEHYGKMFPPEENQLEFFQNLVSEFPAPAKILSVECGPALITQQLAKVHPDVTVTDTFAEFIATVKKSQELSGTSMHTFNLTPHDIGRYLGKNFFNVAMCCNYRLVFMQKRILIEKFMFEVKQLLCPGGYLVLDLINFAKFDFSQVKIELPTKKSDEATLYSYITQDTKNSRYLLNQKLFTNDGKEIDEVSDEEICPISLESFKTFAKEMQYSSIEFYNDYKGTPFSPDSDKIICVLKK